MDEEEKTMPDISTEKLLLIYKRIHKDLMESCSTAKTAAYELRTTEAAEEFLYTSENLYAFTRLLMLAGQLGKEVVLLRKILTGEVDEFAATSDGDLKN